MTNQEKEIQEDKFRNIFNSAKKFVDLHLKAGKAIECFEGEAFKSARVEMRSYKCPHIVRMRFADLIQDLETAYNQAKSKIEGVTPKASKELEIGSIIHTMWGYDETHYSFYVVMRMTAKSVWVRELNKVKTETGFCFGNVVPGETIDFTQDEKRYKRDLNGSDCVTVIDRHSANLYTGDKVLSYSQGR